MPTSDLHIKSFFAASVQEAMTSARAELGPDALLLNTLDAPPEARHLGELEVVFGVRSQETNTASRIPGSDPLKDLRTQIEAFGEVLRRMEHSRDASPVVEEGLFNAGVDRSLAHEIDACVRQRLRERHVIAIGRANASPAGNPHDLIRETTAELKSRLAVMPEVGRIAALVGPPGSGKTTTLVKLAIAKGLLASRPVQILSIDNRIGLAEHLGMYAGILGVSFVLTETVNSLTQAIGSAPADALILIDTPGCTGGSKKEHATLAEFLKSSQDIDTHLVLTASMRHADLDRAVARFTQFGPAKLLFTRLDETESMGSIFCTAARAHLPLSFFTTGQSVPDDLEPATKDRVIGELVRQLPETLQAVA